MVSTLLINPDSLSAAIYPQVSDGLWLHALSTAWILELLPHVIAVTTFDRNWISFRS
jgi:hypothetical protein